MAMSDYRLCDVCGGKAFYDADLNHEEGCDEEWHYPYRTEGKEQHGEKKHQMRLDYLGDWAVICSDCAKTHKTVVVPITPTTERDARTLALEAVVGYAHALKQEQEIAAGFDGKPDRSGEEEMSQASAITGYWHDKILEAARAADPTTTEAGGE